MTIEVKTQKVHFSLPYREGMEKQAGYAGKVDSTSKTYPDEKTFAKFAFDLDNSIEVKESEALEIGYKVLRQNKQRAILIGVVAKQFSITAPGAGGLTKTDKGLISAMGELTKDLGKIAQAFTKKTSKAITAEEIKEILAA